MTAGKTGDGREDRSRSASGSRRRNGGILKGLPGVRQHGPAADAGRSVSKEVSLKGQPRARAF